MSKGLALATMDQEYVNRFSFRSVTLRQRLLQGVQAAGVGIYEGVLGAPLHPPPSTHQLFPSTRPYICISMRRSCCSGLWASWGRHWHYTE